ncbi:hypothetical protein BS17DRAFT_785299 [Gyrodon lividus]|nr:hypothetical protein BS17DRAFT_785299 [Gyrodon lividus]
MTASEHGPKFAHLHVDYPYFPLQEPVHSAQDLPNVFLCSPEASNEGLAIPIPSMRFLVLFYTFAFIVFNS